MLLKTAMSDHLATLTAATVPAKSGRFFKILLWLLGGLLALAVAAWALVPPILKSQLEKLASQELGRTLTVGQIDFKPWSLELTVNDLAVAKADASGPQLQIKRIYLDASGQSYRRLAPVLDALQIDGLDLKLTHWGQGRYDIDDIMAKLNKPKDEKAGPPGFALFNVALTNAKVDFSDKPVNKTHQLRNLNLTLPFLSNLDTDRTVKTEPRLAFVFNGSAFDSNAASTPFTQDHKTDASLRVKALDLKPYLAYIPASVPVALQSAVLDADLKLAFEQKGAVKVKLTGTIQASGVKLADRAGGDLLALESLQLALDDVRPLEGVVKLASVDINSPSVLVQRDKIGQINWASLGRKAVAPAQKAAGGALADASIPTSAKSKDTPAKQAWSVEVVQLKLNNGTVNWQDQTTQPAAQLFVSQLNLQAPNVQWPLVAPQAFQGTALLGPGNASAQAPANAPKVQSARLEWSGSATQELADVEARLDGLQLDWAAPYVAQALVPRLVGVVAAELILQWKPDGLSLNGKKVSIGNLVLLPAVSAKDTVTADARSSPRPKQKSDASSPAIALASLKKIEISNARMDLAKQSLDVGRILLLQPSTLVERSADGHWMFEQWVRSGPQKANSEKVDAAKPWAVKLAEIALDGGSLQFLDQVPAKPVALVVSGLKVGVKQFELGSKKPFALTASLKVNQPQADAGQLDYSGSVALEPLVVQGAVTAQQIPVHAFEPYFADALNVQLLRADAGFKGNVMYLATTGGPTLKITGDALVEELRTLTIAQAEGAQGPATPSVPTGAAEELLTWKALSLRGVDVAMAPGSATQISVAETALTDFFARILVHPSGRINLQDLTKNASKNNVENLIEQKNTQNNTNNATNKDANKSNIYLGNNRELLKDGDKGSFSEKSLNANAGAPTGASGPDPVIRIGPVSLVNGKVFFSDHFIRPNYSANLSELNGRLSAFSSVEASVTAQGAASPAVQMADLELRGRAEGTAPLEILGKLNPLAKPLALDLKAKVRELELPPLSPYSVKYAGHGIERGKMSVDLAYVVQPNGQLEARNNIVLNQLKFGDKVEGAPNSLPVKLAVALLADRNGVIDINLPVSGSLNDPQFSLGSIIFKVIVNLIVKAVLAPFSLLASAFGGGGEELSQVAFAAGSAVLPEAAKATLDKVAKALIDRPAMKMTVVGTASLEVEREAYKQEKLKTLLQAEKRRVQVGAGSGGVGAATTAPPATVVTEAETPALLREAYRRSDIPKPRNLIGIAKDLPQDEVQALLLASIVVTDDTMRDLAVQRGLAVKEYLASKQLPLDRLFLGNVRTGAAAEKGEARSEGAAVVEVAAVAGTTGSAGADAKPGASPAPAKWSPRAELNLAVN